MNLPSDSSSSIPGLVENQAANLALSLAEAESAIQAFTAGQTDAVIDAEGQPYLLRPAQERLMQSEERLQAMFDRAAEATVIVDRGGVVTLENRASQDLFGGEVVLGRSLFSSIHPDDILPLYSTFFNVIEGFLPNAVTTIRFRKSDGGFLLLDITAAVLGTFVPPNLIFVFRKAGSRGDFRSVISRREVELGEALLARDHFLAQLSHELRSPLSPILLGVADLQSDERFKEAEETLKMIGRNVDLQMRLLDDVMAFIAIGQHKVRLRCEPLEIHRIIGLVLGTCRAEISGARMEILLDLRATQSVVQGDLLRIQQILWNLVKNAVKFSPPGDQITIRTSNELAGRLVIEVADRGIGIEASLLPQIFDSFRQGEAAEAIHQHSLGLGLYIAKGLAEAHGGTLIAFSDGPGRGAMFRLTLAAAAAE